MVKRTITITTIVLILSMIVSLIIVLNKSSFAADGDIASGVDGTCSWVIDKDGVFTIRPTNGVSGVIAEHDLINYPPWYYYGENVEKVIVEPGVKCNNKSLLTFANMKNCTEMDIHNLDTSNATNMAGMFSGCASIKQIDLSNFNTSKVTHMGEMFFECSSLESLDLSTFDVRKVKQIEQMFQGCSKLTNLNLSNFETNSAISFYNLFKDCSMLSNLDISGLIINDNASIYNMFLNCNNLKKIKLGEDFRFRSKSNTNESYYYTTLPTPSSSYPYTGKWIREDSRYGPYTSEAIKEEYDGNIMSGVWVWEKSKPTYTVSYQYNGKIPDGASELPEMDSYEEGATVTLAENATAGGYTFSGWSSSDVVISNETFEMPAKDIEITGYFIENPRIYKIEYYFDNELDEALVEILNAEKGEEINLTPQTPVKHGEKNYTLVSNNHNIVVSVNDEDNIIRVYYETDVLDYAIDNFEDTTEGDGIPDKYQIRITYKVENGNWDDGSKGTKADIITLKDKDGNLSEEGTGTTTIPEVGSKPNNGYTKGYWNKVIPSKVSSKDDRKEFVYSYESIDKVKSDISGGKGKSSNPKTDDIVNKYLLVGIGGILVLSLVNKIRRKYSRKAKKIQY